MVINRLTMMKINSEILNFAKVFLFLNLCLSLYAIFFENVIWLLNLQIAFFASLLVTLASFLSYKKMGLSKNDLDTKRKENYPETLLGHIEKSAKTTLESSLKFNQSLFESSVSYYKKQLS